MDSTKFEIFMKQQSALLEAITKITLEKVSSNRLMCQTPNAGSFEAINLISARLESFEYDKQGKTFNEWYTRYGKIIKEEGTSIDDSAKVRILVGKLKAEEYLKFANSVKPKSPMRLVTLKR